MSDPSMSEGNAPFTTPTTQADPHPRQPGTAAPRPPPPRNLGTPPRPPPRRSPTTSPIPASFLSNSPLSYSPNKTTNSNTPPRSNTPGFSNTPPRCNTPRSNTPANTPRSNTPANTPRSDTPVSILRSDTPTISYTPPDCNTPRSSTPAMGSTTSPQTLSPVMTINPASALPAYLTPSGSRRSSLATDIDSRRESINKMASGVVNDFRKSVKNVSDNTKKAGHKVKDRTAMMGTSVKGASHWVAQHTHKSAKQAMLQARSGLSVGEKTMLYLTEKITEWSSKGFTHVLMFLMIAAYTAIGAVLFMAIEGPHETEEKLQIANERSRLIKDLHVESRLHSLEEWESMAKERFRPFEDKLYESFSHGVSSDTDTTVWTFWKSMFFCSTITTTIGYGHMSPVTTAGRTFCIAYAIIGIPLMLILLADFGKLFTRVLKGIFRLIARINRSVRCNQIKNSSAVVGCGCFLRKVCSVTFFCRCFKKKGPEDETVEEGQSSAKDEDETLENYIKDDNFNLPISLALLILVLYILMGCVVFPIWEDWTFFEAFYFIFISISTVGFGDFVPQHPGFMMATTVYFIFGLALTAMCINIIQEKLTNTFSEAKLKMKQSFNNIMAKQREEEELAQAQAQAQAQEQESQDDNSSQVKDDATSSRKVSFGS